LLNSKVRAHSLVDAVTERLEAAIIDGTLAPGSKLKEQVLAASLGVSRGPLREAIRRLEGRKLLKRTPNIGVCVVALSLREVEEILQVQEALQGMACALAAKNMGDADIAALAKLLDHYQRKPNKPEDYDAWDLEFHARIIAGSGNERLGMMLRDDVQLLLEVYHSRSTTTRERAMQVLKDHKEIVAAIARRDSVTAEQLMRQHIQAARKGSLTTLEVPRAEPTPKKTVTRPARRASRIRKA
jgi:DNA-binding GntR family transcriptional regulator